MTRTVQWCSLLLFGHLLCSCDSPPVAKPVQVPPSVTVSRPLQKNITEWDEYTGRFVAVDTVEVRARVSGFINSIHFKDGQLVKQGDLLFVIDPRPYQIAVEQAKAEIERARARLQIATADVERALPLAQSQTLTQREFEMRQSMQHEAAGSVASLEAALKRAELNFEWTEVRALLRERAIEKDGLFDN
jgi:membrane fusion protein, multidrug efflux system